MDWGATAYIVWGGVSLGLAWFAKEIIKPWSDAWRMKIIAESEHLRKVDEALVNMVFETRKQSDSLAGIDQKMQGNNEMLANMHSESKFICKAVGEEKYNELIAAVEELQKQGKEAKEAIILARNEDASR